MKNLITNSIGQYGESLACEYLKGLGYRLLEKNYRNPFGEIDLIFEDGDIVVFVEVKARKNETYGYPREFVTASQQKRIMRSSEIYLQEMNLLDRQMRYDVIEIYLESRTIEHIDNAFPY